MRCCLYISLYSLALALGGGCSGRAVDEPGFDLSTVTTGVYWMKVTELTSDCSTAGVAHGLSSSDSFGIKVNPQRGVVNLTYPGFAPVNESDSDYSLKSVDLAEVDGYTSTRQSKDERCRLNLPNKQEVVLLGAVNDQLRVWIAETWDMQVVPCTGNPKGPCTSSATLEYTLARACEAPCKMTRLGFQLWICQCT